MLRERLRPGLRSPENEHEIVGGQSQMLCQDKAVIARGLLDIPDVP